MIHNTYVLYILFLCIISKIFKSVWLFKYATFSKAFNKNEIVYFPSLFFLLINGYRLGKNGWLRSCFMVILRFLLRATFRLTKITFDHVSFPIGMNPCLIFSTTRPQSTEWFFSRFCSSSFYHHFNLMNILFSRANLMTM